MVSTASLSSRPQHRLGRLCGSPAFNQTTSSTLEVQPGPPEPPSPRLSSPRSASTSTTSSAKTTRTSRRKWPVHRSPSSLQSSSPASSTSPSRAGRRPSACERRPCATSPSSHKPGSSPHSAHSRHASTSTRTAGRAPSSSAVARRTGPLSSTSWSSSSTLRRKTTTSTRSPTFKSSSCVAWAATRTPRSARCTCGRRSSWPRSTSTCSACPPFEVRPAWLSARVGHAAQLTC